MSVVLTGKDFLNNSSGEIEKIEIGFIDQDKIVEAAKPLLFVPTLGGLYYGLTGKNAVEKGVGFAVAGASLAVYFLAGTRVKDDGDNFQDTQGANGADRATVDTFVSKFRNTFSYYFSIDACEILKDYYELPNAEFIGIANAYKKMKGKTLRWEINTTSFICTGTTDWSLKVKDRFDELKIP